MSRASSGNRKTCKVARAMSHEIHGKSSATLRRRPPASRIHACSHHQVLPRSCTDSWRHLCLASYRPDLCRTSTCCCRYQRSNLIGYNRRRNHGHSMLKEATPCHPSQAIQAKHWPQRDGKREMIEWLRALSEEGSSRMRLT